MPERADSKCLACEHLRQGFLDTTDRHTHDVPAGEPRETMPPLLRLAIWIVLAMAGWLAGWLLATVIVKIGMFRWIAEGLR